MFLNFLNDQMLQENSVRELNTELGKVGTNPSQCRFAVHQFPRDIACF